MPLLLSLSPGIERLDFTEVGLPGSIRSWSESWSVASVLIRSFSLLTLVCSWDSTFFRFFNFSILNFTETSSLMVVYVNCWRVEVSQVGDESYEWRMSRDGSSLPPRIFRTCSRGFHFLLWRELSRFVMYKRVHFLMSSMAYLSLGDDCSLIGDVNKFSTNENYCLYSDGI